MYTFLKKQISNQKGDILVGLVAMIISGAVISLIFKYNSQIGEELSSIIKDPLVELEFHSATETMLFAYYKQETDYYLQLADLNCSAAKPFVEALKSGSGCSGSIDVFKSSTLSSALFKTYQGCTIFKDHTTCTNAEDGASYNLASPFPPIKILSIINTQTSGSNPFTKNTFDYYLFSVVPEKQYSEFSAKIQTHKKDGTADRTIKKTFAIKNSGDNFAHLEAYGGVSQENPNPLARCPGVAWGIYKVFNPDPAKFGCQRYEQLGGGTGLAFYDDRFFSFRPADGQIFDLFAASTSNTFLVQEDGTLAGDDVFPEYSKSLLINVDDITVISEGIYYVAGAGINAEIGFIDKAQNKRKQICDLGAMGWGQMYVGISSSPRSQDLTDVSSANEDANANFSLKTDSGDLLTAIVMIKNGKYKCTVIKDMNLQQVEYKRTFGFDRTADKSQVYYY